MEIRSLNDIEREAIRKALKHYIETYGTDSLQCGKSDRAWSQKVVLSDMLDGLLWMKKE